MFHTLTITCSRFLYHLLSTEQQITYYNDGHLCDELGNLVIDVSSNHASPGTRIAPKRRLFSPVRERTPLQSGQGSGGAHQGGGDVRESPELRLDSADGDDWWRRYAGANVVLEEPCIMQKGVCFYQYLPNLSSGCCQWWTVEACLPRT